MDFRPFDSRGYPTVDVAAGYGEWAATYEETVVDLLDLRLLQRLGSVDWPGCRRAADLACGTGRTGAWLKQAGTLPLQSGLSDAVQEYAERGSKTKPGWATVPPAPPPQVNVPGSNTLPHDA